MLRWPALGCPPPRFMLIRLVPTKLVRYKDSLQLLRKAQQALCMQ